MDRLTARAVIVGALALGLVGQALFVGQGLGLNLGLFVTGALALIVIARLSLGPNVGPVDRLDLWIPIAAVAFAIAPALRADGNLVAADTAAAVLLLALSAPVLGGVVVTRRTAGAIAAVAAWVGLKELTGAGLVLRAAQPESPPDWPAGRRRVVALARGSMLAAPILLVFGLLFVSADAVFARSVSRALRLQLDLGDRPDRLAIGLALAWFVAGLVAAAAIAGRLLGSTVEDEWPEPASGSGAVPGWTQVVPARTPIGPAEALVALALVDLFVGLFVALQVAYLFGGRDTLAASGLTYAEYARRGFFELVAASALAIVTVVVIVATVGRPTRAIVGAGILLFGLAAAVLASAGLRLRLYQDAYGWTELRFWVAVSICWLGLAIVAGGVLLLRDRLVWLPHALGAGALAAALFVNLIGPQAFVAEQNLQRVIDTRLVPQGGRSGIDAEYLSTLDDDAVPTMVRALPHLSGADRAQVEAVLAGRADALENDLSLQGIASWNLGRERAREALRTAGR